MARLAAVQALYQMEMTEIGADRVVGEFAQHRLNVEIDGARYVDADRAFFDELVRRAAEDRDELDKSLGTVLTPDWPVARLDRVLRAILRLGIHELRDRTDVPARVVISEYVDVAKAFFDGKEPGLVNGVLDRLAHRFRPEEMDGSAHGRG